MRILIVTQYFWPEPFRINDLVQELLTRGHQVTVLTAQPNYPEGHIYPTFKSSPGNFNYYVGAKILRVPIIPRGKGTLRLAINYFSFALSGVLAGTWLLRRTQSDVIFVFQTSPITVALPALWFRHLTRTPVLMWVLDLWPESLSAVKAVKSKLLIKLVGRLVSFIYRRCDRILVQSMAFLPNIAKYSHDASKVRYFPGWAEPIFQSPLEDALLAPELEPFRATFNIMFTGNIGEAQDFPTILEAAELLKDTTDIRWIIIGDGRAAEALRKEVKTRGLGGCVVQLGRHHQWRMPAFLKGASVLLVSLRKGPAFSLTIPGKLQTYMAAGLPLLGMLDGEGARVIQEAKAGLTCPAGNSVELAKRVQEFLRLSEAERLAMGMRGKTYCNQHFNRRILISNLEAWAEELILEKHEHS